MAVTLKGHELLESRVHEIVVFVNIMTSDVCIQRLLLTCMQKKAPRKELFSCQVFLQNFGGAASDVVCGSACCQQRGNVDLLILATPSASILQKHGLHRL